jgi:hypothetical protein
MGITVHTRNISGLGVDIFQRDDQIAAPRLTVLFILHGRLESRKDVRAQAEHVLKAVYPNSSLTRDLLIVTFVSSIVYTASRIAVDLCFTGPQKSR